MKSHLTMTCRNLPLKQQGFGGAILLAASIGLLVMAAATVENFKQGALNLKLAKAKAQGQQLRSLADGMNTYMVQNSTTLTCGPTVACGTVAGVTDKYHPTINELKTIGVLDYTMQPTGVYGTSILTQVSTVPAGCAGSTCSLTALVYTDSPVIDPASLTVEGSLLGQAILAGGADVGASVVAGNIQGLSGIWSATNPVAGAPAGIVAARSGSGSAFDPQAYLRRDGTLPMTGNLNMAANSINMNGASNTGGGTINLASGTVNNAKTLNMTGSGALNTNGGNVTMNGSGSAKGSISGASMVQSDNLQAAQNVSATSATIDGVMSASTVNTGSMYANSDISGNVVTPRLQAVAGNPCNGTAPGVTTGSLASSANGALLVCVSGIWATAMPTTSTTTTPPATTPGVYYTANKAYKMVQSSLYYSPNGGKSYNHVCDFGSTVLKNDGTYSPTPGATCTVIDGSCLRSGFGTGYGPHYGQFTWQPGALWVQPYSYDSGSAPFSGSSLVCGTPEPSFSVAGWIQ